MSEPKSLSGGLRYFKSPCCHNQTLTRSNQIFCQLSVHPFNFSGRQKKYFIGKFSKETFNFSGCDSNLRKWIEISWRNFSPLPPSKVPQGFPFSTWIHFSSKIFCQRLRLSSAAVITCVFGVTQENFDYHIEFRSKWLWLESYMGLETKSWLGRLVQSSR